MRAEVCVLTGGKEGSRHGSSKTLISEAKNESEQLCAYSAISCSGDISSMTWIVYSSPISMVAKKTRTGDEYSDDRASNES